MTRYLAAPTRAARIDRHRIPSGLEGTKTTAAHVGRLIRSGAGDFYVRQKAIDILMECGVPAKDYLGEIDALFRWVQRHVRYTKDPFQIEVLHSARRMLELRAGDCDDMTIVLGALIKSIGHPVRIVLTGPDARRSDLFSHIYLEARHQDQWIPLDATMPYGMGWSPRTPVKRVLSIEEDHHDVRTATAHRSATTTCRTAAGAGAGAHHAARMVARAAARHRRDRCATQGPARQGAVAPAPSSSVARPFVMGTNEAALHLAEGPQREGAAAHGGALAGAAETAGGAGQHQRHATGALAAPSPSSPSSGARRDHAFADAAAAAGGRAPGRDAQASSAHPPGPADRSSTTGQVGDALQSAASLYQTFNQFPARATRRVAHPRVMPPVVVDLGELAGLVYRSSKWVGRPRTYIHFMDDPPRLVADPSGRRLFIVGGSYRITARGIEG